MKLTQLVLLQSYTNKFNLPEGENLRTPAMPSSVLQGGKVEDKLSAANQTKYRSGVGKMLHMMKWTRPDILNAVQELSRFMTGATMAHMKEMLHAMKYCDSMPK
jgi:hypothetical protein